MASWTKFLLLSLFLTAGISAQDYIPSAHKQSMAEIESAFNDWRSETTLEQEKGYKWYNRWLDHWSQRTTMGGSLPNTNEFAALAQEYTDRKMLAREEGIWLPAGPNYLPSSPDPFSGHGVSRINCIEFHPTDPAIFWIGASQGGIWKTSNSGESWTELNNGLPILRISDISVDPQNADIMYACLGDFEYIGTSLKNDDRKRHTHYGVGLYKSTDGGLSWSPTGLTVNQVDLDASLLRASVVHPTNSNEIVAVGVNGIWKSTDAGDNWELILEDRIMSDLEHHPDNPSVLYAASAYVKRLDDGIAGVYKSEDFGDSWTLLETGLPETGVAQRVELAIAPSDPNIVYALSCNMTNGFHGLYRTADAGQTWTLQSSEAEINVLGWSDGGGNNGQGIYDLALMVHAENPDEIYTGGVNCWASLDGGITWDGVSYWVNYYGESLHADQHQFRYNPLDQHYYICNDGGVMRTDAIIQGSWEGANFEADYKWPTEWENLSNGMQITSFYRLGLSSNNPGNIIAGSQDNSTFFYDGNEWINVIGGDGMECILHPDDPQKFWGSWQYGGLARTMNGGQDFVYGLANSILNTELAAWTSPYSYEPSQSALYFGAGNLYRSLTDGANWEQLSFLENMEGAGYPAPASSIAVCANNPATVYMAKRIFHSSNEPSKLWRTFDDGANWDNITAGLPDSLFFSSVSVHPDDQNTAWIVCSGFSATEKVYKTNDGGSTWENISFNLPNIPVNTLALDKDSELGTIYIGTDLGIYSLDSLATKWNIFGIDLPNVIVSEIEIDFGKRELYAATFGRGIWKAGLPPVEVVMSGINNQSAINLSISPNPNNGHFSFSVNESWVRQNSNKTSSYELVDITGRVFLQGELQAGTSSYDVDLQLNTGVYFLRVRTGEGSVVRKLSVE